jgi:hypothetical protein
MVRQNALLSKSNADAAVEVFDYFLVPQFELGETRVSSDELIDDDLVAACISKHCVGAIGSYEAANSGRLNLPSEESHSSVLDKVPSSLRLRRVGFNDACAT